MLDNGRYVLTVDKSASLADVLPEDAEINFDTKIHVNHQAAKAWTRAPVAPMPLKTCPPDIWRETPSIRQLSSIPTMVALERTCR